MTIKLVLHEGKTWGEFEFENEESAARFWKARGETRGRKKKESTSKVKVSRKVKRPKPKPKAAVAQP